MDLSSTVALVTGANRGLGYHFAAGLLERGARVYAGARHPETVQLAGTVSIGLDITDDASVAAAVLLASDVTLLVNNAGIASGDDLLDGDMGGVRLDMETHYFGTLRMCRAFAPVLAANRGGGIVNVLSVASWITSPSMGSYAAAKSAQWSLTNTLRLRLAPQKTKVIGLHVGYLDTDMASSVPGPRADSTDVVAATLKALAADECEVVFDELSADIRRRLGGGVRATYPALFTSP